MSDSMHKTAADLESPFLDEEIVGDGPGLDVRRELEHGHAETGADLESPFLDEEIVGDGPDLDVRREREEGDQDATFGDEERAAREDTDGAELEAESADAEAERYDDESDEGEFEVSEACEDELESDEESAAAEWRAFDGAGDRPSAGQSALQVRRRIERELTEFDVDTGTLAEHQLGAPATVDGYGSYNVRRGNAAARFWPLVPGTSVAAATAAAPGAPAGAPPRIGIVDVVVVPTEDPKILSAVAVPNLLAHVTAQPTAQSMPLVPDGTGASRICFAVEVSANANHFEGTLRLEIRRGAAAPGTAINVDLPIRVAAGVSVTNLVVFFVVHRNINRRYAWLKLRVLREAPPQTAIVAADIQLSFLRDNLTFQDNNRRMTLRTDASGFGSLGDRDVVAVPIDWPLIFKATAPGFALRGHMVRLAAGDIRNNLTPFVATPPLRMLASNASLQGRRIMLDAGHGAVYSLRTARRSQEWYVAHRIVDRIAELLQQRHSVNAADVFLTRTAGFGMIEPGQIRANNAPESGQRRFEFELANRRVRVLNNAVGLTSLSNLLLTQHTGAAHTAQPIAAADRTRLLTINAATVSTIEARLNQQLGPSRRVRPNSIRWHAGTESYIFTREPAGGGAGDDQPLPVRPTDWWSVDNAMMENLFDRSARWSLESEIGSATQDIPGHPFPAAARTAMLNSGALGYMRDRMRAYLPPAPNHAWATGGTMAWGPTPRVQFFNANRCDIYISIHCNAAGGKGGMSLVSRAAAGTPNAPPQDQIRVAKIALKYLDPFDQGLRQGGIVRENPGNATPPLQNSNQRRDRYLYLEIEFMDARNPANPNIYRYEQMVLQPFIEQVAEQVVAAVLEILLARQGGLDAVRLRNEFRPLW
jgi:N-acetylmuramoyl-L-alanine amidase